MEVEVYKNPKTSLLIIKELLLKDINLDTYFKNATLYVEIVLEGSARKYYTSMVKGGEFKWILD